MKIGWFTNFNQKLNKPKHKKEVSSSASLGWVYGIELDKITKPFKTIDSQSIIYTISSRLIVYNLQCNKQSVYDKHKRTVTAFTFNKRAKVVASAEGDRNAKIHIWSYHNLETLSIIPVDHSHSITLMQFVEEGARLMAVGARWYSPVMSFDTIDYSYLNGVCMSEEIKDIVCLEC